MADFQAVVIVTTSLVTLISGFLLGVYSIQGYLVPPSRVRQRAANYTDPVESEESDVDEGDSILDHAPNWENGVDADRRQGLRVQPEQKKRKASAAAPRIMTWDTMGECKLVLVVRTDLGMTKGKIAAQCGHATLACYKSLLKASQKNAQGLAARILTRWELHGQAKIALKIDSEAEMLELKGKARKLGITVELIQDAGRTQIEPGSLTVLGIGPAPKSLVDETTGHLRLL